MTVRSDYRQHAAAGTGVLSIVNGTSLLIRLGGPSIHTTTKNWKRIDARDGSTVSQVR